MEVVHWSGEAEHTVYTPLYERIQGQNGFDAHAIQKVIFTGVASDDTTQIGIPTGAQIIIKNIQIVQSNTYPLDSSAGGTAAFSRLAVRQKAFADEVFESLAVGPQ